ncbi:MAG: Eco57I restriction-modification methylase domain-containing protein [Candidatus Cloacimonetes bacterium]|nr:Eco57I restriction-modification methylase domain-containing protein [Candidatus Cloacimonadota bacterium]
MAVKFQQRLFEDDKDKREDEKKTREIESRIEEIKNIDVPGPNEHFEWHVNYSEIFQAKGGFDVVIANPPYVNIERLDDKLKQYIFLHYQTCSGRTDIYTAFIENSLAIIKDSGLLTFIIPYAFTNQKYGTKLRKHLIDNYFISEILDTSDYFVFETANVKNIVLRVQKTKNVRNTTIKRAESADDFQRCSLSTFFLDQQQFLDLKDYRFETKYLPEASSMREKILSNTLPFEEICFVAYGARLNHKTKKMGKDHYISESYKATFKPYLEGKNIERYHFAQYGWLSYHPKEHYNPMFAELFENPKLVTINVVKDELRFAFDNKSFYNSHTVINCVKWHFLANAKHISVKRGITKKRITNSSNYDYKYLLAILNSKLMSWYFMCFLSEKLHFYPNDVKSMPIKTISTKDQNPFTKLVDLILAITKSEDYLENPKKQAEVKSLEAEIDQLVYKLYDFTPEEIKIVEGENK